MGHEAMNTEIIHVMTSLFYLDIVPPMEHARLSEESGTE